MMNCGVGSVGVGGVVGTLDSHSLSDWFSFIGLGSERREQQQQKEVSYNNNYCGSSGIGNIGRTPETINESIDMHNDDFDSDDFDGDDGDDDNGNDENINKVSRVESIISKQLSYVQCGKPISNSKKQKFHRRCNPSTCRMTSGMCVDCVRCLKHCVCGDEAKLLPLKCDTPECSHIVCTDCIRCQTHCTCYSDPINMNLLRDENSLVAFSPPSISTPTRHRHQSLFKMKMRKKERVGTKIPKKTTTAVLLQQQLELSRRTHSLLSNDDEDEDDHSDDNCVTTTGNGIHTKNNNRVSSYIRFLSEDENNIDTNSNKFGSTGFHDDVDDDDNDNDTYAEIIVARNKITRTSPITTYEGDSVACPTRASASTAPHRNNHNRRTTSTTRTTSSWLHIGNRNRRRSSTPQT